MSGSDDFGSLTIKSIAIVFHALSGTGSGFKSPYGACLAVFDLLQSLHSEMIFSTTFLIPRK